MREGFLLPIYWNILDDETCFAFFLHAKKKKSNTPPLQPAPTSSPVPFIDPSSPPSRTLPAFQTSTWSFIPPPPSWGGGGLGVWVGKPASFPLFYNEKGGGFVVLLNIGGASLYQCMS
nr:hypothetical protein [Morchella crassipes]